MATDNTSEKFTCIENEYWRNIFLILNLLIVIFSSIFALLFFITFISKKKLQTSLNACILSLSVNDVITTVCITSMMMYYVWDFPEWRGGEVGMIFYNFCWCYSLVVSFVHIIVLMINRYYAIKGPSEELSAKWLKTLIKLFLLFIYSFFVSLLTALNFSLVAEHDWNISPAWYFPVVSLHTMLPLAICVALYRKMREAIRDQKCDRTLREFKNSQPIFAIIIVLYCVWFPVICVDILRAVYPNACVLKQIKMFSALLTFLPSIMNPVFVLVRARVFNRVELLDIMFCKKRKPRPVQIKPPHQTPAVYRRKFTIQEGDSVSKEVRFVHNENVHELNDRGKGKQKWSKAVNFISHANKVFKGF